MIDESFAQWLQQKRREREEQARLDMLRMWQEPGETLEQTQKRVDVLLLAFDKEVPHGQQQLI